MGERAPTLGHTSPTNGNGFPFRAFHHGYQLLTVHGESYAGHYRFTFDRDGIDTMAVAPKQKLTFAIDDALTVEENIAAFALKLKMADAQLTSILTSSLTDFSNEVSVNQDALLEALYAATAPAPEPKAGEDAKDKGAGQ
jgi:hypothetical protein